VTNFQPSLNACLERGCRYMAGDKKRTVCLIGDKVLEDLSECPYDAAQLRVCPISLENTRRNIPISGFVRSLKTWRNRLSETDRAEYQEIISCIVHTARKAGFEIPEADV
jgi:hypothetical protein